jgi:hypothetical protein
MCASCAHTCAVGPCAVKENNKNGRVVVGGGYGYHDVAAGEVEPMGEEGQVDVVTERHLVGNESAPQALAGLFFGQPELQHEVDAPKQRIVQVLHCRHGPRVSVCVSCVSCVS